MERRVNIAALEALINRVKQEQPAAGRALALSAQVSVLAGIYGEMIYCHAADTNQLALTPSQRSALESAVAQFTS
jgi:Protein of unknown function (DUF3717)